MSISASTSSVSAPKKEKDGAAADFDAGIEEVVVILVGGAGRL